MRVRTRFFHLLSVAVLIVAGVGLAGGSAQAAATQSALLTISLGPSEPGNVHYYDITIDPCTGAFSGVSNVADWVPNGETISGTLTGANIGFVALYNASPYTWHGSGPMAAFTGGDNGSGVFTTLSATVTGLTGAGCAPPSISKSFGSSRIELGSTTTLSFTITNPNSSDSLSGVGFVDALPGGLLVATPNGLVGSCGGGSITAVAGSSSVTLSGATLAASASCTFSVAVQGTVLGSKVNTTSAVTSSEGGAGNTATATVTVIPVPTTPTTPTTTPTTPPTATPAAAVVASPQFTG